MTNLVFKAMPTEQALNYQRGALDANQQLPEIVVSDDSSNPCRHCFQEIPVGQGMLILSYKPFIETNPYSEIGPVFLCESECDRHPDSKMLPSLFLRRERMLIRGYSNEGRIVYGTGKVVKTAEIEKAVQQIFDNPEVSYIHLRSEGYNCYHCRIDRA